MDHHRAEERVIALRAGFEPDSGAPLPLLLQTDFKVFLAFYAKPDGPKPTETAEVVALVEFTRCHVTRFGYPNDEALPEHPLYNRGLDYYRFSEVLNSRWSADEREQARRSRREIAGDQLTSGKQDHNWTMRHFIVTLHDSTFECLAENFRVSFHQEPVGEVAQRVIRSTLQRESTG